MKSVKDFINEEVIAEEEVTEDKATSSPKDPPALLVMRRKSVRQFPNGQRVALYYVDKLKQYVTIPYGQTSAGVSTNMSVVKEDVMFHLNEISSTGISKRINFDDNSSIKVGKLTAESVLNVYEALNENNKQKVLDMANKSKQQFMKVVDFASKHTK
jgi:hypothetical protein